MNRVRKRWGFLKRGGLKALIPYVTAGDPNLSATGRLVSLLEQSGADIIELGVPFSDPMADGPVIQRASERALARGTTLKKIVKLVRRVRLKSQVPILLMGYYNPIFAYGVARFAREAAASGVDAVLVVDLPPEESSELDRALKKVGLDLITLLTPTSDANRIALVARRARGFIYFVSMTGITGASLKSESSVRRKIAEIRRRTRLPIVVGFGIRTPEQARRLSRLADGVVVGSALVERIEKSPGRRLIPAVKRFIRPLRAAV